MHQDAMDWRPRNLKLSVVVEDGRAPAGHHQRDMPRGRHHGVNGQLAEHKGGIPRDTRPSLLETVQPLDRAKTDLEKRTAGPPVLVPWQ